MLGAGVGLLPQYRRKIPVPLPPGFGWDQARFPLSVTRLGTGFRSGLEPRALVDPLIWQGLALHVDGDLGDDGNSGLGAVEGDFSAAKRSIHAAFVAGNASGAPYRVIVKPGFYEESAFTRNGNQEPDQPVAIIGWGGKLRYRTGPFAVQWGDAGGSYSAPVSSVKRVFRCDLRDDQGLYRELLQVADAASCTATQESWCDLGGSVRVNIGAAPGESDIALIRSFHGARFLSHARDLYLENIEVEAGISGALHLDAVAARNVVAVNCAFGYAAPSNPASPLDAVRVRRTDGLLAFFDCAASMGAKDGWSFHEDGVGGMHVLLERFTGYRNGIDPATSCNGFTCHDGVRAVVLGGDFGWSRKGTEVHCVQAAQVWLAGSRATARDVDGTSVAFKCSNDARMWLQDCVADAAGAASNLAIEANGGQVHTRAQAVLGGDLLASGAGAISGF
ncbi:hypothetical protein ACFSUD_08530 [Sulfitobacter aestuarii]|uniref:Uncharacterized protein n=1 Tax=Sulfitobacter aestuarii TaxID=2161676 RepID=A0ABW5U3J3_9RHOB